jgi:hypothetical protein
MADETAEVTNVQGGHIMDIGTVAALNIAQTLGLPADKASVIKRAIRDEIMLMSSHFTSAIADVQFQYEAQVRSIKSGWNYAKENQLVLAAWGASIFATGFFTGVILQHIR